MDRLAWQTAWLLNAAGSRPARPGDPAPAAEDERWTPEKLLGRDPMPDDCQPVAPATPEEEAEDAEGRERVLRAKAMLAQAQIKAAQAGGGGRLVDVTPEPG